MAEFAERLATGLTAGAAAKYEEVEGADKLSNDMEVTAYMAILPEKVAEHLKCLDAVIKDLDEVKAYVRKQVDALASPITEVEPTPWTLAS